MLNRILIIYLVIVTAIAIVIGFGFIYRGNVINEKDRRIETLEANTELLIKGRKNDYQNKVELAERVEELHKLAEQDKNCFTWTTDISNSPVVRRLRENRSQIR